MKIEINGQMTIRTDDMELAGNLIQSIAAYLNLADLQVTCDFPQEFEILEQTLLKVKSFFITIGDFNEFIGIYYQTKIDDFKNARQQLTSQMADHSNLIRTLVVRAEDARLMDDMFVDILLIVSIDLMFKF